MQPEPRSARAGNRLRQPKRPAGLPRLRGLTGVGSLLCAILVAVSGPVTSADWNRVAEAFDRRFVDTLDEADVPGGAYVIVHAGLIVGMGSFGHTDSQRQRPVDSATVFRIASLSKGFSGVLAALLADEAGIALNQPVAGYSPSIRLEPNAERPLTIEDVLGQRSGFIRNAYDNLIEAGKTRDEILPRFNTLEPICPPGRCYSYQNNVFSLVEDVIASSSGNSFEEAVTERLFAPLGMTRASVGYDALIRVDNRAAPHLKTRSGWYGTEPRSTYYQVPSAAGINASILDMAQWAIAMLGHRPRIVPPAVIEEVLTPRIRTRRELRNRHWRGLLDDAWYGLGWRIYRVDDMQLALHGGWVAGYRAEIALSHDLDVGLVILSNAETRAVGELNREFWDLALAHALTKEAATTTAANAQSPSSPTEAPDEPGS